MSSLKIKKKVFLIKSYPKERINWFNIYYHPIKGGLPMEKLFGTFGIRRIVNEVLTSHLVVDELLMGDC